MQIILYNTSEISVVFSSSTGNECLYVRNDSVCFSLSYSLRNDSIQGFQGLEERVWKVDEATERKTKNHRKSPLKMMITLGITRLVITNVIVLPQKLNIGWFPSLYSNINIVLGMNL